MVEYPSEEQTRLRNRIRQLDRQIYEEEKERARLNSATNEGGGTFAQEMERLTKVEELLRDMRRERRGLENDLDRLLVAGSNARSLEGESKLRRLEDRGKELSHQKERLLETELPAARRHLQDLQDKLHALEREMSETFHQISDLRNSR